MKLKEYVRERFEHQGFEDFAVYWDEYKGIEAFAPDGNIWESGQSISDEAHFIMRTCTQYYFTKAFNAMKIDLDNPNVAEDLNVGNIGTPGRIAKVWCGFDTHDDTELGFGRWAKKPRLATFPNNGTPKIPITKRVSIVSNCSHHGIVFSTLARPDSYAVISYIPDEYVLGISKLQRIADWVSHRYFLQEDLTKMLYEEVSKAAKTDSVYVGIFNAEHGCESYRGSKTNDGAFTSEYYGGAFEDTELRKQVKG
jgi:GTP cyclohydrolase I